MVVARIEADATEVPRPGDAPRQGQSAPVEVMACDVCGLVREVPGSPVCPACGAGRG